jgi:outer membrane protein
MSALFVTGAYAAELKVGYVNTQRIFRDAPAAQKAAKKLEGEFAKRDQDLSAWPSNCRVCRKIWKRTP